MGTDIHGAIECRPQFGMLMPEAWAYAIDLDLVYMTRDYGHRTGAPAGVTITVRRCTNGETTLAPVVLEASVVFPLRAAARG